MLAVNPLLRHFGALPKLIAMFHVLTGQMSRHMQDMPLYAAT